MASGDSFEAAKFQPYGANFQLPEGTIPVHTYKEYADFIERWSNGLYDGTLIVVGGAGLGKSETALRQLGSRQHCYIKGQASKFGVYNKLAQHIDQPVVLDDVDELLNSSEVTGLLKMLLETRNPKVIQWTTGATVKPDSNLPSEIVTNSRTLVLANELKVVSRNFGAVLDRSLIVWFAPSPEEVHKYVGTWFDLSKHRDVYNYVGERIHLTAYPSCRYYYHGAKLKAAGLPWEKHVDAQMRPSDSKAVLMRALLADKSLKTDKARLAVWQERTGESVQSFYANKRAVNVASGKVSSRSKSISEAMKKKHAERKSKGK